VGRRAVVVGGVDYGPGCTALVRAALERAGRPLPAEVRSAGQLHALAERSGALRAGRRLQPGDVVFLADRPGGKPAHAGLVARADPDGTAVVLHRVARGVARLRLNLAWPQRTNDPSTGRLVNDTLYVGKEAQPAGSLVVGVADLLGPRG
jgi:cell wall-associated NlpC family hydrolase